MMGANGRLVYTPAHASFFLSCCPLAFRSSFFGDNAEILSYTVLVSSHDNRTHKHDGAVFFPVCFTPCYGATCHTQLQKFMSANVQIRGLLMKDILDGVFGERFKLLDFYWVFLHSTSQTCLIFEQYGQYLP